MKSIKLALIFTMLIIVFSGCGETPDDINTDDKTQNENSLQTKIVKTEELSADIAEFTEITSYVGDCDGDGSDEKIILSTAAERDGKGEFLWNDGQNWALYIADDADKCCVLYDGYVQAGSVYFDVADYYMADGAKPVITVTVSTGAGLSVKNYSYSKDEDGYVEEIVYDTQLITAGGINRRFTSVPEILK